MIPLNINFLKSQRTVGELRKVVKEAELFNSPQTKPLEFVETDRGCKPISLTDITRCNSSKDKTADNSKSPIKSQLVTARGEKVLSSDTSKILPSLPRTFNYTKLNNARRNLEWQQAEKELGLIQL